MTTTTALARIAQATGYEREQIQLVKDTIARGASDDELILFLHLARRSGLDPFARQIYLIERRQQVDGQWKTTKQPQTGIDGLRLIADRTERYAPGREPTYGYDADGHLVTATAYVKKWVRGDWHEVAATAHYHEYVGKTSKGEVTRMWAEKPHIMLAKCAEALALRRAFPAEMSGLYTADEMPAPDQASEYRMPPTAPQLVDTQTGEIIDAPANGHQNGASYEPPAEEPAPTKKAPTKEGVIKRIRALWAEERDLGGTAPAAELATDLETLSLEQLIAAGKKLASRVEELKVTRDLGMPEERLPDTLPDVRRQAA